MEGPIQTSSSGAQSPADPIEALRADRIAGKVSDKDFFARMQSLAANPTQPSPALPNTPEAAQAAIETLRAARMAGQVSDLEFRKQMAQLGPTATPQMDLSPEVQAELDAAMEPPADPSGYKFVVLAGDAPTADEQQMEFAVREAFHYAQVPQAVATPVYEGVQALAMRLAEAPEGAIQKHQAEVAERMRAAWGADYEANIAAIEQFVDTIPGRVGETLRANRWMLADPQALTAIHHHLQYRTSKQKGKSNG